ncbi:MAG TPA: C40 family peptidase [Chitinophagaceae bacterium]|nr:C40 family peptidase [Chitinophagaceae bacterium]HPH30696.1 C40 family peptidase [Chitinophagaceae bacterium]HPN59507.1 C40 family peptidase [Chitinophagaceae bacterium]
MKYAIVNVPVAALRRKPRHPKEMVNQLLFGETVQVLKTKGDAWVKVKSLHDNYEGWMTLSLLEETDEITALQKPVFVTAGLLTRISQDSQAMHIPIGASLPNFTEGTCMINKQAFFVEGLVLNRMEHPASSVLIDKLVQPWLNAPYLWGGRTPLGVDCSGFVQVNFKLMGIDLPRDAWQQAQYGEPVESINEAKPGDLVFFDDKEEIVHVGILLNKETVIHASGKVRIDPIDKKGIINAQTGKRTYRLKAIRRYW